jgi:hypothetical protein
MTDFKSKDLFDKYWMLSLGLLEFPVQLIGGTPGGGKSLYDAWFGHRVAKLFGKRCTFDWNPVTPEYFRPYNAKLRIEQINMTLEKLKGYEETYAEHIRRLKEELEFYHKNVNLSLPPYFSMGDEDYIDNINDEFYRLSHIEKETGQPISREELEKFVVYNTNFQFEEADAFDKSNRTNYTKFVAMVGRRRRHVFCGMSFVMIDINRFDLLISGLCTHKVNCIKDGHLPDICSIYVEDVRKGGTGIGKWLLLRPKEWTHLWNSHSVSQVIHNLDINFGKPNKKKVVEEDD